MINKKEIKHIASLARLGLSKEELNSMQKNFSSILDYVETLKKADVSEIEDTFSKKGLKNVFRKDVVEKITEQKRKSLLQQAPDKKGDYFKSKKIL